MIFDALAALLIFKLFGEQGLWVLGITGIITVIRTCTNFNNVLAGMIEAVAEEEE